MINEHVCTPAEFTVAHIALRNTEWQAEPANPLNQKKGLIRKGDSIWFHPKHFGSGPVWQQARLPDHSLRYVHLCDFRKLDYNASKTDLLKPAEPNHTAE